MQADFVLVNIIFFLIAFLAVLGIYLFKNTKPNLSHVRRDFNFIKRKFMSFLGRPTNEDGNVFLAIFGAVAMVGILGASVMTFMKGPLATSVKLTKINTAENQMSIGAQVAVMATASQANNGDCETAPDSYVEPIEWRTATTEPKPTGGGLVPLSLGISKKDPWGTEYGYCVWNHGPTTSGAGCGANMLAGTNSKIYPVVSLVSAGPDKAFTTTCRDFATADVNADGDLLDANDLSLISKAVDTDDDIITTFSYEEATGASGGLWSLKSGDPATAVIDKGIETSGTASLKGGLLLPDKSFVTCDSSTAGVMAMNGSAIEICNGTTWDAITGGSGGAVAGSGLVLSPNVSTGMNVTGGCGTSTCYSSNVVFTLTNNLTPAGPSVALVTTLSNTLNFEFVSNNCSGQILAAGATCQMVVRAKASGNVAYAGTLNVIGNNSPLASLDGTASSFAGCNAGGMGPGGYYVACGVSGSYNLIVTPSGCTGGNTNPTCAGGADTFASRISDFGVPSSFGITAVGLNAGLLNTKNYMAYSGGAVVYDAVSYCDGMTYQGYDDWFLPSISEMATYAYPVRATVGFNGSNARYWSSTEFNFSWNPGDFDSINMTTAAIINDWARAVLFVRCMRRDPPATVTPTVDTTPVAFSFNASYGGPYEMRTSNAVTIYGVTQPISVSVTGGANAQISKNGGAFSASSTTAVNGDQIALRATSPALGQESVVTLTTGATTTNWQVRTPGNNVIRVFVTSSAYNGNRGGLSGADSTCTTLANAAGLTGGWVAVLGTGVGGDSVEPRLPWNWKTLRNMAGATVATSLADFLDGSISAPMNYTQTGAVPASGNIWTGFGINGISPTSVGWGGATTNNTSCYTWTSSGGIIGIFGDSGQTTGANYLLSGGGNCNSGALYRLLCMESNQVGSDTDPADILLSPRVTFASGGTGTSNTVTITSVTDSVSVSIVPSAGTANIIKNGASVGSTTTMAGLNETLSVSATGGTPTFKKNGGQR